MIKKISTICLACLMVMALSACNLLKKDDDKKSNEPNKQTVNIKDVSDFKPSKGLVNYYTVEGKKIAIPETVGEYANYLKQLGTVTLGDTGKTVEDVKLKAKGISSFVQYLKVETDEGLEQHFLVRYKNPTNQEISVAQAKVTQIEVMYKPLSHSNYEKAFKSIQVVTSKQVFKMDGKTKYTLFINKLGSARHVTDGRLEYTDHLGYEYVFDCSNENANGIFRDFIIKYPSK